VDDVWCGLHAGVDAEATGGHTCRHDRIALFCPECRGECGNIFPEEAIDELLRDNCNRRADRAQVSYASASGALDKDQSTVQMCPDGITDDLHIDRLRRKSQCFDDMQLDKHRLASSASAKGTTGGNVGRSARRCFIPVHCSAIDDLDNDRLRVYKRRRCLSRRNSDADSIWHGTSSQAMGVGASGEVRCQTYGTEAAEHPEAMSDNLTVCFAHSAVQSVAVTDAPMVPNQMGSGSTVSNEKCRTTSDLSVSTVVCTATDAPT
jgi:hypothetical protein